MLKNFSGYKPVLVTITPVNMIGNGSDLTLALCSYLIKWSIGHAYSRTVALGSLKLSVIFSSEDIFLSADRILVLLISKRVDILKQLLC